MTVLRAEGLVRRYGAVAAVDGVSIEARRGEVLGVLGPNGAGKSTLFRLLAGVERVNSGQIWLQEKEVTALRLHERVRRGLSWMPQHPSVLPRLSVRANLALMAGDDVDRALSDADLVAQADQLAGSLSGGERRRLELARCVAQKPSVVLLDEPFAGVEPLRIEGWASRIRAVAASGVAVVLTDHAVMAAMQCCDRVCLLDHGQVLSRGTPSEVAADPIARERYLGPDFPGG